MPDYNLQFTTSCVFGTSDMWQKVLMSDMTTTELADMHAKCMFGGNTAHRIERTITMKYYGDGSIML